MYYRIYGEKVVIAVGFYAGYVAPPVPELPKEKKYFKEIVDRSYVPKLF